MTDKIGMSRLDQDLLFDYLKQSKIHVEDFETNMLNYLETGNSKYIEICFKKIYILHRTAKSINLDNFVSLYDQLEVLIGFLRNSKKENFINSDFLVESIDYINEVHQKLFENINVEVDHASFLKKCKNFISLNNQKVVHTPEFFQKDNLDKNHREIYDLAKDLYTLNSSLELGAVDEGQLNNISFLSQKLFELTHALNLVEMKNFVINVKKSVSLLTNYQATYHVFGERFMIENKYHEVLERPISEMIAGLLRKDHGLELYVKSYESEVKQYLCFDFKCENAQDVLIDEHLQEFKTLGIDYDVFYNQEGISLKLILDKSYDLLDGYVFEFDNSTFVIERSFIQENIELNNDNLIFLENSGYYLLYKGKNIPVINQKDIAISKQDIFPKPMFGIILKSENDQVVLPIDAFGSFQKVIKKSGHLISFDRNKFKSVSFLSNGKPVFVFNAYELIRAEKDRELRIKKYLECYLDDFKLAFRASDVCEVVSINLLSKSYIDDNSLGLINYQGQAISVYSPERVGIKIEEAKLHNIAVLKSGNNFLAFAISENMSITTIDDSKIHSNHAFTTNINPEAILESYTSHNSEVNVINPQFLFIQQLHLKKVA